MPLNLTALAELKARLLAAQEDEARAILAVADERIPKDTETAEKSGRVVRDGDTVYITFGSDADSNPRTGQPSNTYIEALHENMEARHPNGSAKFLQSAGDDAVSGLAERVAGKARI